MKNYIDKDQKAKDTKSTGYTFTGVGIIGIVFLLLINLKVILFTMSLNQQILITVVMGLVFLIFLIIGIISFKQVSKLTKDAGEQKETEEQVISDFMDQYSEKIKDIAKDDHTQDAFFVRNQEILDILKSDYPDLAEEDIEHYADVLYEKIFSDEDEETES